MSPREEVEVIFSELSGYDSSGSYWLRNPKFNLQDWENVDGEYDYEP